MWLHAVPRCRGVSRPACVVFLLCTPDGVSENSRWLSDSATTGNWPPSKRIRIRRDECGSRSCGVALGQKERPASVFSGGFRDSACRCGCLNHEWARMEGWVTGPDGLRRSAFLAGQCRLRGGALWGLAGCFCDEETPGCLISVWVQSGRRWCGFVQRHSRQLLGRGAEIPADSDRF